MAEFIGPRTFHAPSSREPNFLSLHETPVSFWVETSLEIKIIFEGMRQNIHQKVNDKQIALFLYNRLLSNKNICKT